MTVGVKICGINDPAAFDTAVAAEADWVGFNFFPPSPRYVTPALAADLSARSAGGPLRVGLFVDPSPEAIAATLDAVRLDALQLYGAVDLPGLRSRFGLPVWRAVGVATADDICAITEGADRLVVEAKPPADATRPGGNAVRFDWSLLRGWKAPAPWILAGGLTPDNVVAAVRITGASAVDVSSGVEGARGVKDPALIRAFIANARSAGTDLSGACPSGVDIRRATLSDAEALGQTHVQAWRETYAGLVPETLLAGLDPRQRASMWRDALSKGTDVQIAVRDGDVVGLGSTGPQRDASLPQSAEIHAIYVLQSAQRLGVGRALMRTMADDLLTSGHRSAALWVLEGNVPARRFYEALGGKEVTRREQQRDGFSAIGVAYGWDDLTVLGSRR